MKTAGIKILTPVFFRPMIRRVLDAALAVAHRSIRVVVGAEEGNVREECRDYPELRFRRRETPLGTADAVRAVEPDLSGEEGDVLVLYADRVLVTAGSLQGMLAAHAKSGAACTRVESARTGKNCMLGPYAHLRPGTLLADEVRVGNFVEIKSARIGARTKVFHLSCIGDASVGRDVNVGCGFAACNSDGGPIKQRTIIEDGVFIGSDSQAIAPVTLGAGCFVATGTSVTDDVPPDSFVISRGRQVTKPGYAKKYGRGRAAATRSVP